VLPAVPALATVPTAQPTPATAQHDHSFQLWLAADHTAAVTQLQAFLREQRLDTVLPMPQLLSNSRDWRKCGSPPFAIAPAPLWPNMTATLRLFALLQNRQLLTEYEITSSYRDTALNTCAGGRPSSSHLLNAALDLRVTSADAGTQIASLCEFWKSEGANWSMGLGFYADQQLHIDTRGYRTWGPDTTRNSSPCR
jgi:hypothetical protein